MTTVMAVTTLEEWMYRRRRASFDVESAMTRDRTDEQPEEQALDDPRVMSLIRGCGRTRSLK